jgi:hypothetical protein
MIRRALIAATVILVILLSAVIPVLAASYTAMVSVTENGTASYEMTGLGIPADNDWMADNGFFDSTARDTIIETVGGIEYPHMVTDNATYFSSAIPQGSQTNLYFTTGNSAQDMYIVPGHGGYVTVADNNTSMEPADNFTMTLTDTFVGEFTGSLAYKLGSIDIHVPEPGNVSAGILGTGNYIWTVPTSNSTSTNWVNPPNAYDDDTGTYAQISFTGISTSNYLVLTLSNPVKANAVRYYVTKESASINAIELDYYDGTWHSIYSGAITESSYQTKTFTEASNITQIRARFNNQSSGVTAWARVHELHIGRDILQVSASVAPGEHDIELSADSTNLTLSIDGQVEDTVALDGSSVPNTVNNWVIGSSATPYIGSFELEVDGTQVCYFAPNNIITGTTLPDRSGNGNNGTITFGSNPSGISISLGSLTSGTQPTPAASIGDTTPRDILPPSQVDPSGDINIVALQGNILYGILLIEPLSDLSGFSEGQLWRLYGFMFVLLVTAGTAMLVRSHMVISGVACVGSMWYLYHLTIFPWWSLIISGVVLVTTLIMERQPSV